MLLPCDLVLCVKSCAADCSSPSVARFLEQKVGVTNGRKGRVLKKGEVFRAGQGTVRFGRLEVYSTLGDTDVSEILFSRRCGLIPRGSYLFAD